MKPFIEGEDRNQSTLFPDCLEDYIAGDNPVRVVDELKPTAQSIANRMRRPRTPLWGTPRDSDPPASTT